MPPYNSNHFSYLKINKKVNRYVLGLIIFLTVFVFWVNFNGLARNESSREKKIYLRGEGDVVFPFLKAYVSPHHKYRDWASQGKIGESRRVAMITTEIEGPVLGGGIGTAYTALSQKLVEDGHQVTVILVNQVKKLTPQHWIDFYQSKGIELVILDLQLNILQLEQITGDKITLGVTGCTGACIRSYKVYQYLQTRSDDFDIIHFHDNGGIAYFSVLSKHQGLYFKKSIFVVGGHGPHLWERTANSANLDDGKHFEIDFLERKSVELSDWLVSPSNYMLNWMLSSGWQLPNNSFVHQNLLPGQNQILFLESDLEAARHDFNEILFFGRLESRKGLDIFMIAIESMAGSLRANKTSVTFLGGNTKLVEFDMMADVYLTKRCKDLNLQCQVLVGKTHTEAIEYLTSHKENALVVVASPIDNSPNTVLECLTHQIPLIATNVGGIPELIHPDDRERIMFYPRAASLVKKLQQLKKTGIYAARFSIDEWSRQKIWSNWHSIVQIPADNEQKQQDQFLRLNDEKESFRIGIFLTLQRNFQQIKNTVTDILNNFDRMTKSNSRLFKIQIIIIKSTVNKGFSEEQMEFLEQFTTITVNELLIDPIFQVWNSVELMRFKSQFDYYLIFDYQNQLYLEDSLNLMLNVLKQTNADIISSSIQYSYSYNSSSPGSNGETTVSSGSYNISSIYMGCNGIPGIMYNCYGTNNFLIRSSLLARLSKEFPNDLDYHFEIDQGGAWELYAEATNNNYLLETVPMNLFKSNKPELEIASTYKQELGVMKSFENILPKSFALTTLATRHFLTSKRIYINEILQLNQRNKELEERNLKLQEQYEKLTAPKSREYNEEGVENTYAEQRNHIEMLFVRGHEKSGTSWLKKIVNLHPRVFLASQEFHFHYLEDGLAKFTHAPWAASKEPYFSYTKSWYKSFVRQLMLSGVSPTQAPIIEWAGEKTPSPLAPIISGSRYILIVRDGRDVVVSLFWHYVRLGGFENWCGPDSKDTPLVKQEFVDSFRANTSYYLENPHELLAQEKCFRHIAKGWADRVKSDKKTMNDVKDDPLVAQIHQITYEEMHRDPETIRNNIYRFLNLDPNEAELLSVDDHTAPGGFDENDPKNKFFRKGEIGDWKNYFNDETKRWFKEEAGHVLVDLGYEINNDW